MGAAAELRSERAAREAGDARQRLAGARVLESAGPAPRAGARVRGRGRAREPRSGGRRARTRAPYPWAEARAHPRLANEDPRPRPVCQQERAPPRARDRAGAPGFIAAVQHPLQQTKAFRNAACGRILYGPWLLNDDVGRPKPGQDEGDTERGGSVGDHDHGAGQRGLWTRRCGPVYAWAAHRSAEARVRRPARWGPRAGARAPRAPARAPRDAAARVRIGATPPVAVGPPTCAAADRRAIVCSLRSHYLLRRLLSLDVMQQPAARTRRR